jgi:hypothetical protein
MMVPRDDSFWREIDQLRTNDKSLEKEVVQIKIDLAQLREEYRPISRLVYGCTTLVLSAIIIALIGLVIKTGGVVR